VESEHNSSALIIGQRQYCLWISKTSESSVVYKMQHRQPNPMVTVDNMSIPTLEKRISFGRICSSTDKMR